MPEHFTTPSKQTVSELWTQHQTANEPVLIKAGMVDNNERQRFMRADFSTVYRNYTKNTLLWGDGETDMHLRSLGFETTERLTDRDYMNRAEAFARLQADKDAILSSLDVASGMPGAASKLISLLSPENLQRMEAVLHTEYRDIAMVGIKGWILANEFPGPFGPGNTFHFPGFNPEASKLMKADPEAFNQELVLRERYHLEGFRNPGEDTLVRWGVPPVWATMITEMAIDPATYSDAPIAVGLDIITWGRNLWVMKQALKSGIRVDQKYINEATTRLTRNLEEAKNFKAAHQPALQRSLGTAPKLDFPGGPGILSSPDAIEGLLKLKKQARLPLKEVERIDRSLVKMADEMGINERREFLRLRSMQSTTQEDIISFQKNFSRYKDEIPDDWYKGKLTDGYYNKATGEVEEFPAGIVREYHDSTTPKEYLVTDKDGVVQWADTEAARQMQKVVGSPEDLKRMRDMPFVGNDPDIRATQVALLKAFEENGEQTAATFGRFGLRFRGKPVAASIRQPIRNLQNTPAFQPMVKAMEFSRTMQEARMAQLINAMGGKVVKFDESLMGILRGGRSGFAIKKMPKKMGDDFEDGLMILVGGDPFKKAIAARRQAAGLDPLDYATLRKNPELSATADRLRFFWDDLGDEAMNAGLISPDQWVNEYLPIFRAKMDNGMDIESAIRQMDSAFTKAGSTAHRPFFAMIRNGEISPTELNLQTLTEAYTKALYRHKYVKPVADDLMRIATDPKNAMGVQERAVMIDWITHQTGGVTDLQNFALAGVLENKDLLRELGKGQGAIKSALDKASDADFLQWGKNHGRLVADMYYGGWMAFRPGLANRNFLQKTLAWNLLGKGLPGGPARSGKYFADAYARGRDSAFKIRFADSAREAGWLRQSIEFAEDQFDNLNKGNAVTRGIRKAKDFGLLHYSYEDLNNRMIVYAAAESYADDLIKASKGAKNNAGYKAAAKNMTTDEGARFVQAIENGADEEARKIMGRWMVNETQYLYNAANRPAFIKGATIGLGRGGSINVGKMAYMFQTWPQNAAELTIQAFTAGARTQTNLMAQVVAGTEQAITFWTPYLATGYALHGLSLRAHHETGSGANLGSWILPDAPKALKRAIDWDEGSVLPLPIPGALSRVPGSPPPLGSVIAMSRLLAEIAWEGMLSPDEDVSAAAINAVRADTPLMPKFTEGFLRPVGEMLGLTLEEGNPLQRLGAAALGVPPAGSRRDEMSTYQDVRGALGYPQFGEDQ